MRPTRRVSSFNHRGLPEPGRGRGNKIVNPLYDFSRPTIADYRKLTEATMTTNTLTDRVRQIADMGIVRTEPQETA